MSFGNLSKMLDKTTKILENYKDPIKSSYDLVLIKNMVYKELSSEFVEATMSIVDQLFNRLVDVNYTFKKSVSFENGKNSFREYEETYPDVKVPEKYKQLDIHFNKLKDLPQPAQRSQEWYDYRYNRITASDTAAAIDLNPYEPVEGFILKKCDPNFPFRDNATVFHGKKYEPTATMIYEHIYNTRMFEFGALPSEKYNFLGASPDGISSKYTLDNKFSERLGTMLEIKCPVSRDIHTHGAIAGDICPFYYYCQVQQQLACCELERCDFWQCKLSEYANRDEYLADDCSSVSNTVGTDATKIDVDNRLKKGVILEFYPKNFVPEFEGDMAEWKSKYIIPKRLDMDNEQYNTWTIEMLDKYKTLYPDIHKDYYFYRIIYWKLEMSHNVEIKRDDKFMLSILPILKDTWEKIKYYRNNQDKLDELKVVAERRKKYIRINTGYTISNASIIKNKYLFLEQGFDKTLLIVKPKAAYNGYKSSNYKAKEPVLKDNDSDLEDFDGGPCDFIDDVVSVDNKIKHTNFTSKVYKPKKTVITKTNAVNDCGFVD